MSVDATPERTSAPSSWIQRTRTGLAAAGSAARRPIERLRGGKQPAGDVGAPETASAADEGQGSPTDLADADVSVQRAWGHVRLAIAIIAVVAPVVMALISWRIKVWRAERRGRRFKL